MTKEQIINEQQQAAWYERYYSKNGVDRNDPRSNRGAVLQILAAEAALIRAFHHIPGSLERTQLVDVGCGSGERFFEFFRLGFRPENVKGVDLQSERINAGRAILPQVDLRQGDATAMTVESESTDFVSELGMLATLPDSDVRSKIADEMIRICRSGGYILLSDWRVPKYGDKEYKALTRRDLNDLFKVGETTEWVATENGALIPPVGRFFSAHMRWLYFPIAAILPFLVGQVVYVLRKN